MVSERVVEMTELSLNLRNKIKETEREACVCTIGDSGVV